MTAASSKWILSASDRAYRRLLSVYPKEFRQAYGQQMAQVFRDCSRLAYQRNGIRGVLRLWPPTLGDLITNAAAEHISTLMQKLRRHKVLLNAHAWPMLHWQGGNMLHITNGDSVGGTLQRTGLPGEVLAWKDVLHEGPTPSGLSLDQMREIRARFIADNAWGAYDDVLADFIHRDTVLAQFHTHKEVVLWFEHDLYDQLQLIQLLDWFAQHDLGNTTISLICINAFPGIENFKGLGQLKPAQLRTLFDTRHKVTEAELTLGSAAWKAYCSPDPTAIEALLSQDTSALPFLRPTLIRHLEQFPAVQSGLSRTERQILEVVAAGVYKPVEVFLAEQEKEESAFMGDSALWSYIGALCNSQTPLLQLANGGAFSPALERQSRKDFMEQVLVLTEQGRAVLAGQVDWIRSNGIDRWLGGVHLSGRNALWRWDGQQKRLVMKEIRS